MTCTPQYIIYMHNCCKEPKTIFMYYYMWHIYVSAICAQLKLKYLLLTTMRNKYTLKKPLK